ncbi:MAG: DUF5611 family protein [Methanocorpusculum sp.]|nr:DUF5611 family protein [Methanocorpusculum sp.]
MQEYEVKRGNTKDLEDRIKSGFADIFQTEPIEKDGHYSISYGSMQLLEVWPGEKNKTVVVDTVTDEDVLAMPDEKADGIILDTNKRFRQYLDLVTCFTTKERVKRAKKAAEKED